MLTAAEVETLLLEYMDEQGWGDYWGEWEGSRPHRKIGGLTGQWQSMPVDFREGQELREVVLRWTCLDQQTRYFRKIGCHRSWDGTYWDGPFSEVFPREVVKTEWVPV